MERSSLSRSKGSRLPVDFTTVSSRSCTRSKVVKRAPQFGPCRRRRIAELSSVGRASFTCVSSLPPHGHRLVPPLLHTPRPPPPSSLPISFSLLFVPLFFFPFL